MEPPRTAILGVPAAFDQSRFFQPVDDPTQSDRFDVEVIGKLDLAKTWLTPEPGQRSPLGTCHTKRRGAAIELAAQAVRRLSDFKG